MAKTIHAIGGIPTKIVTIGLLIIEAVTKSPASKPRSEPKIRDIEKPKKALFIVIAISFCMFSLCKIKNRVFIVSFGLGKAKFP